MATKYASIEDYHAAQPDWAREICEILQTELTRLLPEAETKIWHGHPVWFLDGNPVAGYSLLKRGVRLLFWSGRSFDEPELGEEGSFMAAEKCYRQVSDVDLESLRRWAGKARDIQWDYQNLIKRKGALVRIK